MTEELPAPAVQSVKVVAELLADGFEALPNGVPLAMLIAAACALLLTIAERLLPASWRRWVPSSASIGLAFVFPANMSATIFLGGLIALLLRTVVRDWSNRLLIAACTGLFIGDTLTELVFGVERLLEGAS